ncbi:hypothetical protein Bbelb_400620 [Branchiostoma belcheri]|nr:hypothetical protein Bbelb_400620 [Branchiostoma belcheri]
MIKVDKRSTIEWYRIWEYFPAGSSNQPLDGQTDQLWAARSQGKGVTITCDSVEFALRIVSIAVTVQRGQRSPHSGPAGMSTPPIAVAAGRNPLSTTAVTPPHLGLRPL